MYEETQRQLQITVDQYGVAQRRLQALQAELEEMRANMEAVTILNMEIFLYYLYCRTFLFTI